MEDIQTLYQKNYYRLFLLAKKITKSDEESEDVVSEVFFRFLICKSSIKNVDSYLSWMTKNVSIEFLRRKDKIYLQNQYDISENDLVDNNDPYEEPDKIKAEVLAAIESLPGLRKKVMKLYLAGVNKREISSILNINYQTVKNYRYRSLAQLKEILKPMLSKM